MILLVSVEKRAESVATYQYVDLQVASDKHQDVVGHLQQVLGDNLRRYRLARGMSQEAFADLLNIHRTYMGGVERGERNLTLRSIERIAEILGEDPVWLLTEDDD